MSESLWTLEDAKESQQRSLLRGTHRWYLLTPDFDPDGSPDDKLMFAYSLPGDPGLSGEEDAARAIDFMQEDADAGDELAKKALTAVWATRLRGGVVR